MGNCLLIKLKEAIQNENLPVYGESYFEFEAVPSAGVTAYAAQITVSTPITLTVEGTYFSDNSQTANYGNKLENYNGTFFYVKRPQSGSVKIKISNKYAITTFRAVYDGGYGTAVKLNDDTLKYSVDTEIINLNLGDSTLIHPEESLARLIKLGEFEWRAFNGSFLLNTLAENQIANGRDYTSYPHLKLYLNRYKNKYFDGNEVKPIPSGIIYIVYKAGGYELREGTVDGTLLYDSLA